MGPIPLTTPARTLIDLAAILTPARLQHSLDGALHRKLTSVEELVRRLDRINSRGRPGISILRRFLQEAVDEGPPQSVLERRFMRLMHGAGLPPPVRQFEIDIGWERPIHVDFAYPDVKVAIETDGYRTHSERTQWEQDRRRDAALTALGWIVLRFSWSDIDRRPDYVVSTIRRVLSVMIMNR